VRVAKCFAEAEKGSMSGRVAVCCVAFVALGAFVGMIATQDISWVDAGTSRRLFSFGTLPARNPVKPISHGLDQFSSSLQKSGVDQLPSFPSLQKSVDDLAKLEEESEELKLELLKLEVQRMESQLDRMNVPIHGYTPTKKYFQKLKQQSAEGQQDNAGHKAGWSQGSLMLGGFGGLAMVALGIWGGRSAVSHSGQRAALSAVSMSMAEEGAVDASTRREFLSKVAGASAFLGAAAANAEVDYAGVGYLGGSKTIDVNNANVRVYAKLPGLYPNAAGKIVSNAPYKSREDMYSKCKFTSGESAAVKKYDSNFIFLEPKPEYIIDNINNGLYR